MGCNMRLQGLCARKSFCSEGCSSRLNQRMHEILSYGTKYEMGAAWLILSFQGIGICLLAV